MALADLNKGVANKIMNLPLAADPAQAIQQPAPATPDQTPKTLDPVTPTERIVQVVPQATDFPSVPDVLVPSQMPSVPDQTTAAQQPASLPPPGTAQASSSDKDINFAKLRTKLEATSAELVELKSKYFDADGKSLKPEFVQSKEEVERLKQELQATQDRLARYNLMEDPRFVRKYQSRLGKIEGEAKRVLKDFGIDEALLSEASKLPPKERHALILEKAPDAQYMIEPLLIQADQVRSEQQAELDDWKNTMQRLDIERTGETESKVRQIKEALHSAVTRQLEDEGNFLLKEVAGNEKWNAGVRQLKQDMRNALEINDPKSQTKLIFQGMLQPITTQLFMQERAKRVELERQLAILGGVRPEIGSRGTGSPASSGQLPTEQATPQNVAANNKKRFFGV